MVTDTFPNTSNNPGPQPGTDGAAAEGSSERAGDGSWPAGAPSAPDMLHSLTQGAHETIDRLAEQAAPHVERLQDSMASTTDMLDARADQLREIGDEWLETLRCTVRENPLAALGAAVALGLLVARLSR